jgi:hypothetical protein
MSTVLAAGVIDQRLWDDLIAAHDAEVASVFRLSFDFFATLEERRSSRVD